MRETLWRRKGTITYTYDALGSKLKKTTVETPSSANGNKTITSTTLYQGGFVYESKTISPADPARPNYTDKLLFISHEEGRIRAVYNNLSAPNTPTGFVYDYFLKDHLGNIRMVLTDEYKQDIYPAATLEGSLAANGSPNAAYVEKNYYNINSAYVVASTTATGITNYPNHNGNPPANPNPNSVVTANSAKLYKLNSGTNKTGLGITLKVMAGDRIDIFGKSYYFTNNTGGAGANSAIPIIDILTGLLGGPTGGVAANAHGGVTATQLNGMGDVTSGIGTLLGNQTADAANTPLVPKAYINYIFFDEQFKVAGSGFSKVGSNSAVKTHTDLSNKIAPKNGYVYIYVSNESPVNVFFDNLQVIHTRGAILEETHYYPFGLTMAGISSKALNNAVENKRRFNYGSELQNKEFSDGSGLDIYDTRFRQLDPQIGRWWQIDAHAEYHLGTTPYGYVLNNPLLYNDPFGLDTVRVNGEGSHKIKVAQGDVLAWTIGETTSYYTYDPNNKNAVNGFVGEGIDGGTLPEVKVSSDKSQNQEQPNVSLGYAFPWGSAAGTAASIGSHLMFNKSGWYSFSQSKFYSPRFYGNQYTAGGQKAAKAASIKLTRIGYGIGAWNAFDINRQYRTGKIGQGQMMAEQGMNAISTFGGIYGAAAGVGWELGRGVSSIPWYRANIRPLIQDGLGIDRDEYPRTPFLDQVINEMDKQ